MCNSSITPDASRPINDLSQTEFAANWHNFFGQCGGDDPHGRCSVSPAPELQKKIDKAIEKMRKLAPDGMADMVNLNPRPRVGFNDGLIVPGTELPLGTPPMAARNYAAERTPLTGNVRVVVVLVDFSDEQFPAGSAQRFEDLFFSTGVIATGSVKEYFDDVTNGSVNIIGQVVGPYRMPETLADYAGGSSGTGNHTPNARDMARDAAEAANPAVNFGPYDNDGDGYVDAFVVVHAGRGAEQTGSGNHIWSHKWVMRSTYNTDSTKLYAYLTIPEDARLGVCAHELGHLLFGFPDLYDTDGSSSGIGNWCLMAGGSWNGGGDTPAHPSAWCKAQQGWVTVTNVTSNGVRSIPDVKTSHEVFRLWKDGRAGQEYFLVENRQRTGYDAQLPGEGLLVWHIDDAVSTNSSESHPKVALEQADGDDDLRSGANRGDAGDPYPGSSNTTLFDKNSTPNSRSYAGSDTCVAVASVSASGATMSADLRVRCQVKPFYKDLRDNKLIEKSKTEKLKAEKFKFEKPKFDKYPIEKRFEKKPEKPITDKSVAYDKDDFEKRVDKRIDKKPEKPVIDKSVGYDKNDYEKRVEKPGEGGGYGIDMDYDLYEMEQRLEMMEMTLASMVPFIDEELRPDLEHSDLMDEDDLQHMQDAARGNQATAKRLLDTRQD